MAKTVHRPKPLSVKVHLPHKNWERYTTRRVKVVTCLTVLCYAIDFFIHIHMAAKGGELLFGAVLGHCLLEVEG